MKFFLFATILFLSIISYKKKENFVRDTEIAITASADSAKAIAKEAWIYGFPLPLQPGQSQNQNL